MKYCDYDAVLGAMERLLEILANNPDDLLAKLEPVIENYPRDGMTRQQEWRYKQVVARLAEFRLKSAQ